MEESLATAPAPALAVPILGVPNSVMYKPPAQLGEVSIHNRAEEQRHRIALFMKNPLGWVIAKRAQSSLGSIPSSFENIHGVMLF
jgi:hypothetical protein